MRREGPSAEATLNPRMGLRAPGWLRAGRSGGADPESGQLEEGGRGQLGQVDRGVRVQGLGEHGDKAADPLILSVWSRGVP